MTLWELLATTDHRVMSWQDTEWPCWPQGSRLIHWQDQHSQHRATAVFDPDYQVLALELIIDQAESLRWIAADRVQAFQEALSDQGIEDTAKPGELQALYHEFLACLR